MSHRHTSHEHEHDFEVEPGLPQPLPKGERVLWKGSPDWRVLARDGFHLRKLAVYFAALVVWRIVSVTYDNPDLKTAIVPVVMAVGLASVALGIVALLAWFSARTTIYTITDRRVVMRVGIVLSVTFNLPFKHVEGADLKPMKSGHGDIALSLDTSTRIAYLHLWPHARPWKIARVQPSLRSIPDAADVARALTSAWTALRANEASLDVAQPPVLAKSPSPLRPSLRPTIRPVILADAQPRLVAAASQAAAQAVRTGRIRSTAEAA